MMGYSDARETDIDKALEAGCDEYETKPVNLERLLYKIEALINSDSGQSDTD